MAKMNNGTVEHYLSFGDVAAAFGCRPVSHKTRNAEKLMAQRQSFSKHHLCRNCGSPMAFLPMSNIFVCQNKDCDGIPIERKDAEGNLLSKNVIPAFDLLDDEGARIANYIF